MSLTAVNVIIKKNNEVFGSMYDHNFEIYHRRFVRGYVAS